MTASEQAPVNEGEYYTRGAADVPLTRVNPLLEGVTRVESTVVEVTPEMAQTWLDVPTVQRAIKRGTVGKYRRAMLRGEFVVAEPILLADDGGVVNGRHRLTAVVQSGVTLRLPVLCGYNADNVWAAIDDNSRRTNADNLEALGTYRPAEVASVLSVLWREKTGQSVYYSSSSAAPSTRELVEDPEEVKKAIASIMALTSLETHLKKKGARGVFHYLNLKFRELDEDLAWKFFEGLADGVGLEGDDPVLLLRERCIDGERKGGIRKNLPRKYLMALCIKAWNMRRTGRRAKLLSYHGKNERFPKII